MPKKAEGYCLERTITRQRLKRGWEGASRRSALESLERGHLAEEQTAVDAARFIDDIGEDDGHARGARRRDQPLIGRQSPRADVRVVAFSRGSYTVRARASLIRMYGVAMPGNEALVPYAIRMLWGMRGDDRVVRAKAYDQANQFKASLSIADCTPHFVRVWDTVSSVGWVGSPVSLPHTRTNDQIAIFRYAVVIDERRAFFRTNLFQPSSGQDAVQLWFPGDHCDVGGGHPEAESGLSKYPLDWVARLGRQGC